MLTVISSSSLLLMIVSRLSFCTEIPSDTVRHPWTLSFTVSDQPTGQLYLGQIQFFLLFEDGHRENLATSNGIFTSGMSQKYATNFPTQSGLSYLVMRTSGMCLRPIPIARVELSCQTTGKTYSKALNNTTVVDKCRQVLGTQIIDFEEIDMAEPKFCTVNNKRYENGEHFVIGCDASCHCTNGQYACVDLCPATAVRSKTPCQAVNIVGHCCPQYRCQPAEEAEPGVAEQCDPIIQDREIQPDPGTNYGYPSAVYVCNNKECTDERVGAVLISNSWAMAPLVTDWNSTEVRVFIARPTENGIYRYGVDRTIVNENASVTLFKLNDVVPNTLMVQPANLPLTSAMCAKMTASSCSKFTKIGWNFRLGNDIAPNLNIDAARLADAKECPPTKPNTNTICLTSNSASCNVGPVYVKRDKNVQYLVSMQIYYSKSGNGCRPADQTESVISICPHLDWIRKVLMQPVAIQK